MADIAVFIIGDRVRQGRERRALRVFYATRGAYFEGLEKQKAIENFEVGIAGPAAPSDITAVWMVRGTEDQLRAVRESKEFRRLMVRAALVVENIRVVRFLIGGQPLLEVAPGVRRGDQRSERSGGLSPLEPPRGRRASAGFRGSSRPL